MIRTSSHHAGRCRHLSAEQRSTDGQHRHVPAGEACQLVCPGRRVTGTAARPAGLSHASRPALPNAARSSHVPRHGLKRHTGSAHW